MLESLKMAGWSGWLLAFVGFIGAIASVACVVAAGTRNGDARARTSGLGLATVPMVFATLAFGIGILGLVLGRKRIEAALAGVDMPSVTESILHEGFLETLWCVRIGLIAGAIPFGLGVLAIVLGIARRKEGDTSGALIAPSIAGALALGAAAVCFSQLARPLPGRDFSDATPGERDLYDAAILIPDGRVDLGCTKLVDVVHDRPEFRATHESGTMRSAPLPDLGAIETLAPSFLAFTAQCSERLVASLEADPKNMNTPRRLADFRTLSAGVALDARAKFYERIDKLFAGPADASVQVPYSPFSAGGGGIGLDSFGAPAASTLGLGDFGMPRSTTNLPKIRVGATTVNGRLPPEVIQRIVRQNFGRFRLCYENGLRKTPTLQGRVSIAFVIDAKGEIGSIAEAQGTDLPDPDVRKCVVRAFAGMSFPQPEGGIVKVTYPLIFQPPDAPTTGPPAP